MLETAYGCLLFFLMLVWTNWTTSVLIGALKTAGRAVGWSVDLPLSPNTVTIGLADWNAMEDKDQDTHSTITYILTILFPGRVLIRRDKCSYPP